MQNQHSQKKKKNGTVWGQREVELGLQDMDKSSYNYALNINTIWQVLFDILSLETVKTKCGLNKLHNYKMDLGKELVNWFF